MKYFILALTLTLFAISPFSLSAQGTLAVVDMKRILNDSKAAKSIVEQVDEKRDEYQEEITETENKLREEEQDLSEQRTVLSKEAFDEKAKEFSSQYLEAQMLVQARRSQLENAYVDARKKVLAKAEEIIKNIAAEKGYSVAVPKAQTLFVKDELEITDAVLSKLDDELPEVEVEVKEIKEN